MIVEIVYPSEDMSYRCDSSWYSNEGEIKDALTIVFPDIVNDKIIYCNNIEEYTRLTSALIKITNDVGVEKTTISLG